MIHQLDPAPAAVERLQEIVVGVVDGDIHLAVFREIAGGMLENEAAVGAGFGKIVGGSEAAELALGKCGVGVGRGALDLARAGTLLTEIGLDDLGRQTFARWAGQWWRWADGHHRNLVDDGVRAIVWTTLRRVDLEFLDKRDGNKKKSRPLDPNRTRVTSVIDAMCAVTDSVPPLADVPFALPGYEGPAPARVAVVRNGVLDPRTRELHPPTPRLFATAGSAVDFDPEATCPVWEQFLVSVFTDEDGTDHESIRLLCQVFGWLVANDTTRHSIPILLGPPRSGKSTMTTVLERLLGAGNVCSPSPMSLASNNFGLQSMVGKTLAIIPDARIGKQADQAILAQKLLTISGRDTVDVDRKFLTPLSVRLGCRLMIVSNVLPAINDASGALASRFLIVHTRT